MDINRLDVDCLGKGRILSKAEAANIRATKMVFDELKKNLLLCTDKKFSNSQQKTIKIRRPVRVQASNG